MKTIFQFFIFTTLFAFSFTQIEDGCDLPVDTVHLLNEEVLYNFS